MRRLNQKEDYVHTIRKSNQVVPAHCIVEVELTNPTKTKNKHTRATLLDCPNHSHFPTKHRSGPRREPSKIDATTTQHTRQNWIEQTREEAPANAKLQRRPHLVQDGRRKIALHERWLSNTLLDQEPYNQSWSTHMKHTPRSQIASRTTASKIRPCKQSTVTHEACVLTNSAALLFGNLLMVSRWKKKTAHPDKTCGTTGKVDDRAKLAQLSCLFFLPFRKLFE